MKVSELLNTPDCWTQGALARDAEGNPLIGAGDEKAVAFCLSGACARVFGGCAEMSVQATSVQYSRIEQAIRKLFADRIIDTELCREQPLNNLDVVVEFNDHEDTTFEDVQRVLKEAGL